MDRIYASLERLRVLWLDLERAQPKTAKYEALMKQIRAESDAYRALVDAEKKLPRR